MDFDAPPTDPLPALRAWLDEARTTGMNNPDAMTLATVDPDGRPSARTVLLKGLDGERALFFTNRLSRKGRALAANPHAALLFYWDALHRQVTLEGPVSQTGDAVSDTYFAGRPRGARIGAWASRQSQPIGDRAELEARVAELEARYPGDDVPRPPHWGGYAVTLERIEFWHGRQDRLHDRIAYHRTADGWRVERLSP